MSTFQVGNRLLPRLEAVEEIAGVQAELFALAAGLVLDWFRPELDRSGLLDALRPPRRVYSGELRHCVLRRDFAVGRQDKAATGNGQASQRAAKFEATLRLPGTRFPVRPDCGES